MSDNNTPTVRALFTVTGLARSHYYTDSVEIKLSAVYDEQIPEELRFSQATPSGEMTLTVNNPEAIERLLPDGKMGRKFYLDFIPAD